MSSTPSQHPHRTLQDLRDRGSYRASEAGVGFDPQSTVLLVIDPVNDFLSEGGAAWEMTKSTVQSHDVIGHLRQAIDAAREHGIPVIYGPMAYTEEDYVQGRDAVPLRHQPADVRAEDVPGRFLGRGLPSRPQARYR